MIPTEHTTVLQVALLLAASAIVFAVVASTLYYVHSVHGAKRRATAHVIYDEIDGTPIVLPGDEMPNTQPITGGRAPIAMEEPRVTVYDSAGANVTAGHADPEPLRRPRFLHEFETLPTLGELVAARNAPTLPIARPVRTSAPDEPRVDSIHFDSSDVPSIPAHIEKPAIAEFEALADAESTPVTELAPMAEIVPVEIESPPAHIVVTTAAPVLARPSIERLTAGLLPEGLRTLEVTPVANVKPGMTVRAAFTFRNLGGAAASGFRARFSEPAGLTYLSGSATVDGIPLAADDALVGVYGAEIGDLAAGGECVIALAYTVAAIVEDGTELALQAEIASPLVPVIGSNIVRLIVRSIPVLANERTTLAIRPLGDVVAGGQLALVMQVHNGGQSTARDIMVRLPVPARTTYIAQSAQVRGTDGIADASAHAFGTAHPVIVASAVRPGETIEVSYRVQIEPALEDATSIVVHASVCSQEVGEFALPPAAVTVFSEPNFTTTETFVRIESQSDVAAGDRIRIVAGVRNAGSATARNVTLALTLPEGLSPLPGSLSIDATSTLAADPALRQIALPDLAPGMAIDLALWVAVQSPIADGSSLSVVATLVWTKGQRAFERTLTARSAARFPQNFNRIERLSPERVAPGDPLSYVLTIRNMGTDLAHDATLEVIADNINHLRVGENGSDVSLDGSTLRLGTLAPGGSRSLRIDGYVADTIADQTRLGIRAILQTAATGRSELVGPTHVVDSAPAFSTQTSRLIVDDSGPLRHLSAVRARLVLTNDGTDDARAVRVAIDYPAELQIEGLTADKSVAFGHIPAGGALQADLLLRLTGNVPADRIRIGARIVADNLMPLPLAAVELATHTEPSFESATLTNVPVGSVEAAAEALYTLTLRNDGNGTAKRLCARLTTLTNAVYAQASTTVNGVALQDIAGTSLLLGREGMQFANVAPGVEVSLRWRAIVNTPLPPATLIECVVAVQWDDACEILVRAEPLAVHATSALPVFAPSLPFAVVGAVAATNRVAKPSTLPSLPV